MLRNYCKLLQSTTMHQTWLFLL